MEFRILGPIEVVAGGSSLSLAAGKQRALLAILLLHANRTVARDRIIDDLWGDAPPDSARKMVQVYIAHLRKALPEPRVRTRGPGYVLEVAPDELDLDLFERLSEEGRSALADGDAEYAATLLRRALALWRGSALAEFSEPFARDERARLEELRVSTLESRLAADLELGRHAELTGELETLVRQFPLRERLREMHMLALYRSGRQAEALASYQRFRQTIDEQLGLAPSASLKDLERRMLQQDPELEAPHPPRHVVPRTAEARTPTRDAGLESGEIGYARSGDVRIAYQLVGDGPLDLILVHGWVCTFQPAWENPRMAGFYRRLAEMGRLILFDKRGTGLSDRVSPERLPDLETRMDDVRAVMDAIGSERAVVLGVSEGGSMSALFAATYPERAVALVLMGAFARMMRAPDYPFGITEEEYQRRLVVLDSDDWARQAATEWLGRVAPDLLRDEAAVRWYVSYLMRGASPAANHAIRIMNRDIDVRDILPTIAVPTLVLCRSDEYFRDGTRFLGERIPGATLIELPGNDHLPWEGDRDALLTKVEQFLDGLHDEVAPDRVLATLLFTDIVGSTAKAAELGDSEWQKVLAQHHRIVRAQLARFRGREIGTTGDGVFAAFDGPARAVRCAGAIAQAVGTIGLEVRAGVHTGEIHQEDGEMRGIAVHIAARIMAEAEPGEVLVSSTVKDIVAGSGISFEERGERELKGVPDAWRVYAARPT
jgi:DNA-binding SARP family transcriptional activator/pimeloyl-ACP methyl ester carboxylesterase